ncbi:hypothetical protein B484DRAFT_395041, partial [Ochromonadaceae sp. CCMP2298]
MWLCGLLVALLAAAAALHNGLHPLVVDYDEHYYYTSLRAKMAESLSISNCSVGGDVAAGPRGPRGQKFKAGKAGTADIMVKKLTPPPSVVSKWSAENRARPGRLFALVTDPLCVSDKYKNVLKGRYKRAKGCYKVYAMDKNGFMKKRFNDYGATLHPEHVRCDNDAVQQVCSHSASTGMQVVPDRFRHMHQTPFLATAKRAIVGKGGMFGLPCGPFGLFASCEAVK